MAVTEWETMTAEEMLIDLFSEQNNATMSKAALEILVSPTLTVAALRTKVPEIKNSLWYTTNKKQDLKSSKLKLVSLN